MLLIAGPDLSISFIRCIYFSVIDLAVYLPDLKPACNSSIVISSRSNGYGLKGAAIFSITVCAKENEGNDAAAILPAIPVFRNFLRLLMPGLPGLRAMVIFTLRNRYIREGNEKNFHYCFVAGYIDEK